MNKIEIKLGDIDFNMGVFSSELYVDGVRLAHKAFVDLRYLTKSVQISGNHEIFTCSCGCAMCAGIEEPIFVHHQADAIEWQFNTIDCFGGGEDLSDADYERLNTPGIFRFDPLEYQQAIDQGLNSVRVALAKNVRFESPSTRYPPGVIGLLTTRMFSERDHVKDRSCMAQEIVLRGSDGMWITANGIPFAIEELSLPHELSDLYIDFESSEQFPQAADDVVAYETFLNKGRVFGRALRKYLGGQCSVKLWYRYGRVVKPEVWSVVEELC